jgi:hypothetical protein
MIIILLYFRVKKKDIQTPLWFVCFIKKILMNFSIEQKQKLTEHQDMTIRIGN